MRYEMDMVGQADSADLSGKTFLPTIILCTMTPTLSTVLMSGAETLTAWENYASIDGKLSCIDS
jgi:hypothetical protein